MTPASAPSPTEPPGNPRFLAGPCGPLACHVAGSASAPPLLLLHSINAAASVHEVRPLFEALQNRYRIYAPDLPGFGCSARPAVVYTPDLMVEAIGCVLTEIRREYAPQIAVDALALSLSCEFLARAAVASPAAFRSLALVSPTGFSGRRPQLGPPGSTRALPRLHRVLTGTPAGEWIFRQLVRPGVIRYFLRRTWGRDEIDETMFRAAVATAHQPGAHHAPLCFLCGFFFSRDMMRVYRALRGPVWLVHGTRGDFVDYRQAEAFSNDPAWSVQVRPTGALPWFEEPESFLSDYAAFLSCGRSPDPASSPPI